MITLAGLAAWAVLGQGSLPETPVSFSTSAGNIGVVVDALAKQTGVPLAVTASMKSDVVVLHAEGVPLNKLLARVGEVTEGTWELSGTTWTLVPNRAVREAARLARRADRLKKLREELAKASKPPAEADKNPEAFPAMDFMGGGDWRVARMVSTLELGTLVDLPTGGRVVYATTPTRMQRSFTPNARHIQEMIAEHNKAAATEKEDTGTGTDEESEKIAAWMRRMGMDRKTKPITEAPAKVLLAIQNGGMFGDSMLQASLKVYDRNGNVLLTSQTSLMLGMIAESFGGAEVPEDGEKPKPPAPKDDSPKLELSAIGKEFSKIVAGMEQVLMGGSNLKFSDEMKRIAARPAEFEPLGYFLGDYLVQAAKHRKQTLVANLPDSALEASDGVREGTTVNQFVKKLEDRDAVKMTADGSMWLIAPADGDKNRRERTDRVALQALLTSADASGALQLVRVAEFASKSPQFGFQNPLPILGSMIVAPTLMRYGFEPKAWDALSLYGSLTQGQRDDLDRGARIPFAGMTPAQLSHAARLVYGADPQIEVGADASEGEMGGLFGMMFRGFTTGGNDKDYREEPTEVAPTGLQSAGFLAAKVTQDFVFQPSGTNPMLTMMGLSGAEEIAMFSMFRETAGNEAGAFLPDMKELKVGTRKTIRLSLQLTPEAAVRTTLNDDRMPADGKTYTMDTLPAEVKARLEKAKEALKKMDMPFMDPSIFQRRSIPPTR